jgi:hypothetical protein
MEPEKTKSLGQIAYEKHIELCFYSVPRWNQRTALWSELTDKIMEEWEQVANAVLAAANAEVVQDFNIEEATV